MRCPTCSRRRWRGTLRGGLGRVPAVDRLGVARAGERRSSPPCTSARPNWALPTEGRSGNEPCPRRGQDGATCTTTQTRCVMTSTGGRGFPSAAATWSRWSSRSTIGQGDGEVLVGGRERSRAATAGRHLSDGSRWKRSGNAGKKPRPANDPTAASDSDRPCRAPCSATGAHAPESDADGTAGPGSAGNLPRARASWRSWAASGRIFRQDSPAKTGRWRMNVSSPQRFAFRPPTRQRCAGRVPARGRTRRRASGPADR